MRKIIQYYSHYYKGSGGVETHITDLVKNLNCKNKILADAIPGLPSVINLSNDAEIIRLKPINYNLASSKCKYINYLRSPLTAYTDIRRMKNKHKFLIEEDFDLAHFHDAGIGGVLTTLAAKMGSEILNNTLLKLADFSYIEKKVLTVHGLSHFFTENPIIINFQMRFIEKFNNLICVDQNIFEYLNEKLGETHNIWFIPNSVDDARFSFTPLSNDKKLKIGFVGRLEKSRGISYLFDTIANLPPNTEMYVLGAGNQMALDRFANKIDMSKIHFEKNIGYEDIHHFYRKIDVLFNPAGGFNPNGSYGISRVTLEAMSSGRPVLMLGSNKRFPIIDRKTGYLVKPEINEIVALLDYINDSRDELNAIAYNARKIVESEFSTKIIIPKIEKIYEEILSSKA